MIAQLISTTTRQYQQRIAPRGSALYYSTLYTPSSQRQAILFVCGLHQALRRIILNCNELPVTKIKLQWWRQQIDKLYDGRAEHPIAQVLQHYVAPFTLAAEQFLSMIDATEHYLENAPFQTLAQQQDYILATTGAREQLIAAIMDTSLPLDLRQPLACGLACAEQIARFPENIAHGHHFFAMETLDARAVKIGECASGAISPELRQFFNQQRSDADRGLIVPAASSLPAVTVIRCHLARALLKKLATHNWEKIVALTPLFQLYTAWRYRAK